MQEGYEMPKSVHLNFSVELPKKIAGNLDILFHGTQQTHFWVHTSDFPAISQNQLYQTVVEGCLIVTLGDKTCVYWFAKDFYMKQTVDHEAVLREIIDESIKKITPTSSNTIPFREPFLQTVSGFTFLR